MVTHENKKYSSSATELSGTSATRNPVGTADDCFRAMQHHHARARNPQMIVPGSLPEKRLDEANSPGAKALSGDIIYGARAIAEFIFGDGGNKARRRVFNLWAHYNVRHEKAGFFKLKGAVCLSKSQWRSFHGLE